MAEVMINNYLQEKTQRFNSGNSDRKVKIGRKPEFFSG